jgi:hypothetical protein
MSKAHEERHPFLDDLTENAELISSVLRGPVIGRADIRRVVDAVGSCYVEQTPTFLGTFGSKTLLEYQARLISGERVEASVVIDHNPDGSVPHVSVRMSSVDAIVALAAHLKSALSNSVPSELFL